MKKKISRKTSSKAVSRKQIKKTKPAEYPAYMLGIALAVVLLAEGALFSHAAPSDWKAGLSMLDTSSGVTAMVSDVKFAFEPTIFTFHAVDNFYAQAAVASTDYLDLSKPDSNSLMVVLGVNNFYDVASREMAGVLDLSNYSNPWQAQAQVAGASISH